jgi:hypothetical protein
MKTRHLIRIAALAGVCLVGAGFAGAAFAGLPWAGARAHAAAARTRHAGDLCVTFDSDDQPACLGRGPRGQRGPHGPRGLIGRTGAIGPVGLIGSVGAVGPQGPVGPSGPRGIQGIQGIQGPPGAFTAGGSDPGGNTVVVLGSKLGPITITNGPDTGTELTPVVARCPTAGPDREAYDGGAIITTAHPNQPGPTNDVVGLENSFPGLYNGPTEVDPLPIGATPGAVSAQPANAYEAQAVITQIQSLDNVTVQAYVVCGP